MNPLALDLRNFGPYAGEHTLTFEDGFTGILATVVNGPEGIDSNGGGKSTLLEGVLIALYGPVDGTMRDAITNTGDHTDTSVCLTFEHGEQTFRVRRGYSARTKQGKPTLDFEIYAMHTWAPLSREKVAETQAAIEETLGMTRDMLLASAIALQSVASFASKDIPRRNDMSAGQQRKQLLMDAVGVDRYAGRLAIVKDRRKVAKAELDTLQGKLADAREQLAGLADAEQEAVQRRTDLITAEAARKVAEAALDAAVEAYQQAREQTSAVETARARLAAAESEHGQLAQVRKDADSAQFALVGTEDTVAELQALVGGLDAAVAEEQRLRTEVEGHRRAVAEHQAAEREQRAATDRVADLARRAEALTVQAEQALAKAATLREHEHGETCDRCGQELQAEARQRALVSFEEEAHAAIEQSDGLQEQAQAVAIPAVGEPPLAPDHSGYQAAVVAVAEARAADRELAALNERLAGLRAKVAAAETPSFLAEMKDRQRALVDANTAHEHALTAADGIDTGAIQRQGVEARANANQAQQTLDQARTAKARADERLGHLHGLQRRLEETAPQEAALTTQLAVLTDANTAYSRNGIPAMLLENVAIPYLEAKASEILGRLGTPWQIELRTQRANQSGDGAQDVLDVIVVKEHGVEQPYHRFSGGEEERIRFALMVALAELMASRKDTGSDAFMYDEPKYLDRAGMETLAAVLRDMVESGRFRKAVLVSHIAELREAAFDHVIEVVKDGSVSKIAGGADVGAALMADGVFV